VVLFVGSIFGLINNGDRILVDRNMGAFDWVKLAVTYLVPYYVATHDAARHATRHAGGKEGDNPPGIS
jgi:hypothetical protein